VLEGIIPQTGLGQQAGVKIKVDTMPPVGFETEEGLIAAAFFILCEMFYAA
jgi:hypothetical protein